jgi:hypothetical protein
MSPRSDFCLASSRNQAERILRDLSAADFSATELSLLLLDQVPPGPGATRHPWDGAPELGPVIIPGEKPLLAAGPISQAMGARTVGGMAGGLVDFGIPGPEAGRYEPRLHEHHILMAVHTSNVDRGRQARDIFVAAEAADIFTMMTVTTPKAPLAAPLA